MPTLDRGAGGVDTCAGVHYGVAYLFGQTIRERASAFIRIAHPRFREELTDWAVRAHYLSARQAVSLEAVA